MSHSGLLCASNTKKLEEVQQRAMEAIKEQEQGGTFKKRLREGDFSVLGRVRENMIAVYNCLMKGYREIEPDSSQWCTVDE